MAEGEFAVKGVWVAALVAALLLQCWSIFWLQDTIWDNEKLLLFDHLNRLAAGDGLNQLNLARIPSLIPDYLLGWLIAWFSKEVRLQYLIYVWIVTMLQLLLEGLLLCKLVGMGLPRAVLVVTGLQILLLGISFPLAINLQISHLPLNHGGNALLWLLFLLLLLKALARPEVQRWQGWGLGCLACGACLSNRLFVLQAIVPSLLLILPLNGSQQRRLGLPIFCGALLGLLASERLILSGCLPIFAFSSVDLVAHLKELFAIRWWISLGWSVGAGYVLLTGIILAALLVWGSESHHYTSPETDTRRRYGSFILWGGLFTLLPYPWLLQSQGLTGGSLRYLLPLLLITPVSLAVILARASTVFSPRQQRFLWSAGLALVLVAFNRVGMGPLWPKIFMDWHHPLVESIEALIPSGAAVLTAEEGQSLLSSRALKAGSNWRLHVSQIAGNGHANPWDQGRGEFFDKPHQLRSYAALVVVPERRVIALGWFGAPAHTYNLDEAGTMLWLFDEAGRHRIKEALQRDLAGRFRVKCA